MNILESFSLESKVWIYQSDRILSDNEFNLLENGLKEFCRIWTAHDIKLNATFLIKYKRIIILIVDESKAQTSGCIIDNSVHFLANFGRLNHINFFDKMQMPYLENDVIKTINFNQISYAFKTFVINDSTLFLNLNISTLAALDTLIMPFNKHWLYKQVI